MNILAYVIFAVLFFGSWLLFGYAFQMPYPLNFGMFAAGLLVACGSLAIPFHLLGRLD
jgi:ABC-type Na+ efflux pump permease subunit